MRIIALIFLCSLIVSCSSKDYKVCDLDHYIKSNSVAILGAVFNFLLYTIEIEHAVFRYAFIIYCNGEIMAKSKQPIEVKPATKKLLNKLQHRNRRKKITT